MNAEFLSALDVLEKEKNIDKEELIEAIETSITSAYKKNYNNNQNVEVVLNRKTGEIKIFVDWLVVDNLMDEDTEMLVEDAQAYNPNVGIGDVLKVEIAPRDFGRIAAQHAKQQIVQKIKDAERTTIYNEFLDQQEEMIWGVVSRTEKNPPKYDGAIVYVSLNKCEARMLPNDQIPGEEYKSGKRILVYISDVKKTTKDTLVSVSRSHVGLVKRLFESAVPEIFDGIVEIKSIAREAGSRTKISVKSNDSKIDPVGACVGHHGVRVQSVIKEINGEKIDIIKYSDSIHEYIANALSPAKIMKVLPYQSNKAPGEKPEKKALVVVDDFQFSLAIGKDGQNVRLAAKLTGWKIDIKTASTYKKMLEENPDLPNQFIYESEVVDLSVLKGDLDDVLNIVVEEPMSISDEVSEVCEESETFDTFDAIPEDQLDGKIEVFGEILPDEGELKEEAGSAEDLLEDEETAEVIIFGDDAAQETAEEATDVEMHSEKSTDMVDSGDVVDEIQDPEDVPEAVED